MHIRQVSNATSSDTLAASGSYLQRLATGLFSEAPTTTVAPLRSTLARLATAVIGTFGTSRGDAAHVPAPWPLANTSAPGRSAAEPVRQGLNSLHPLQFHGFDAVPARQREEAIARSRLAFDDSTQSIEFAETNTHQERLIAAENADVAHLLGITPQSEIGIGDLIAAAVDFACQDGASKAVLARQIQLSSGRFGGHAQEVMSSAYQNTVIGDWILLNIFGEPMEQAIEKRMANSAQPSHFTTEKIRHFLSHENLLSRSSARSDVKDWVWNNVILERLPILAYSQEKDLRHIGALKLNEFAWGQIHAGLLFGKSAGLDVADIAPREAAALGKMLLAQLAEGIISAEWKQLFRLPSRFRFAPAHADEIQNRRTEEIAGLEQRALTGFLDDHEQLIRKNCPFTTFNQRFSQWSTRTELARAIVEQQCPTVSLSSYLSWGTAFCASGPATSNYLYAGLGTGPQLMPRTGFYLDNINHKFSAQNQKLASAFAVTDMLVLSAAVLELDAKEAEFMCTAELAFAQAHFSAADQIRGQPLAANLLARQGLTVHLKPDLELIAASTAAEQRVYVLEKNSDGYQILRVDRTTANFYPFLGEDNRPLFDQSFKLKMVVLKDVIKEQGKTLDETFLRALARKHESAFLQQLNEHGYDATELEQLFMFARSLLPFYNCVTAAHDGRAAEAALSCSIDALSLIPLLGISARISVSFGQALARGSLMTMRNAVGEMAARHSLRALARRAKSDFLVQAVAPASAAVRGSELVSLMIAGARSLDPGLEVSVRLGLTSARQIMRLGAHIKETIPGLVSIERKINRALKKLPRPKEMDGYVMAKVAGSRDEVAVIRLAGDQWRGKPVFVKIDVKTGHPYGLKYTLADDRFLHRIPIDVARRLNNVLAQGLGGKGAVDRWTAHGREIDAALLRELRQQRRQRGAGERPSMAEFALQNRVDPVLLARYLRDSGSLTPLGRRLMDGSSQAGIVSALTARAAVPPARVATAAPITLNKLGFHAKVQGQDKALTYSFKNDLFFYKERYLYPAINDDGSIDLAAAFREIWCKLDADADPVSMVKLTEEQAHRELAQSSLKTDAHRLATLKACGVDLGLTMTVDGRAVWRPDTTNERDIPAQIVSIWVGKNRMPEEMLQLVNKNAALVRAGIEQTGADFGYKLYLSTESETYKDLTERDRIANVDIIALEESAFFREFKESINYQQYQAALQGNSELPDGRTHYASCADILRFSLMKHEGGIYMDVDDVLKDFPQKIDRKLPDDGMMLGGELSFPSMRMRDQFVTSIFGTQRGNPTLDKISQEIHRQFASHPEFYRSWKKDESGDYPVRLSQMTGPALFNRVLMEELAAVSQVKQAFALMVSSVLERDIAMRTEINAMVNNSYVMRLAGKHVAGSLQSWKSA